MFAVVRSFFVASRYFCFLLLKKILLYGACTDTSILANVVNYQIRIRVANRLALDCEAAGKTNWG